MCVSVCLCVCVCVSVCVSVCVLLCLCCCEDKFVQERGVARLWEVVRFDSYFVATRSSQMNVEVANDVGPEY